MIHYIVGDATRPVDSKSPPFIVNMVNNIGAWKRLVLSLSAKRPETSKWFSG